MPSNPTPLLGVEQQAAGENLNVWGDPHLNDALQRLTEAIAATTSVGAYPTTLTSTNYVANQARNMILSCTGTGGTITVPTQSKLYIVRNASAGDVTITTGSGTNAVVATGDIYPVICDGTNCRASQRLDMQNQVIRNLANGVSNLDAVNKQQIDAVLAAAQAYTDATAFESASLPGQAGQAGNFLTTNGTTTAWAPVYPSFAGTTDYILYSTGAASAWGSPATIRTKLSLGGAALLNVGTTAGTVAAGDDSRIIGAAQKSGAVFTGAVSGPNATFTNLVIGLASGGTFTGIFSGNASSTTRWATPRDISLTGDGAATWTGVDGQANYTTTLTLASTGVTAATYSNANFAVDAKGRITSASSSLVSGVTAQWAIRVGDLLIKGGQVTTNASGVGAVVFTTPFPNGLFQVQTTPQQGSAAQAWITGAGLASTSGFTAFSNAEAAGVMTPTAMPVSWIAFGT